MKIGKTRNYVIVLVSMLMLTTSLSGLALAGSKEISTDSKDTTHPVLIEHCTASDCYYCHFVDDAFPDVEGDYERVSLAHSHYSAADAYNDAISSRITELGTAGFPRLYFDGNYEFINGGWLGMQSDMQNAYDVCAERVVADLDCELTVQWLGDAELEIEVSVENTDSSSSYDGHVKVYILEIESRWPKYGGGQMVNGLLGFSIEEDITIDAGGSWHDFHTWDGDDYGYGDITPDNIRVVAVVFDQSTMYVDDVIGVFPITNLAPTAEFSYSPTDPDVSELITFTDESVDSDGSIVNWTWDFGNGDSSTVQNPTYTYSEEGLYLVSLTVEDDDGAIAYYEEMIVVSSDNLLTMQSTSDRGFPIRHAADGDWAAAQSYSFSTSGSINSNYIYLRKFGTPEFDLAVELRENDPEGTLLDTLTFTPGEVPTNWEWFKLDFTDTTITIGTDYFIVIPPAPSGVTTSFGYEWGYAFGDQYADGAFWFTRDGGDLWRDLPDTYEFAFSVLGS
jgi:PKD repeat protein